MPSLSIQRRFILSNSILLIAVAIAPRVAAADPIVDEKAMLVAMQGTPREHALPPIVAEAIVAADEDRYADAVAGEIGQRRRGIADCYARALRNKPSLAGHVELRFTVAADGTLRGLRLANNSLRDRQVGRCVTSLLHGARLPAPTRGGLRFAYPLRFQPPRTDAVPTLGGAQ